MKKSITIEDILKGLECPTRIPFDDQDYCVDFNPSCRFFSEKRTYAQGLEKIYCGCDYFKRLNQKEIYK